MKAELEILESNSRKFYKRKLAIYEKHYAKILKKLTYKKRVFYNKSDF